MRLGTVAILAILIFKISGMLDLSWPLIIVVIILIDYIEYEDG